MAEVCRLDWHIAPLRADRWLDLWEPAAAKMPAYGAKSWSLTRSDRRPARLPADLDLGEPLRLRTLLVLGGDRGRAGRDHRLLRHAAAAHLAHPARRRVGQPASAALQRGHRQPRRLELLPVVLGRLARARPDDRLAAVVDRSAIRWPWSRLTPGRTRARVWATCSKVLWLSLRTITRQFPPRPEPGPASRGRSTVVVDIARHYASHQQAAGQPLPLSAWNRRSAGTGGARGLLLPRERRLDAGRLPRRRRLLRDQRLPDHLAAAARVPPRRPRPARPLLAAAGAAAAAGGRRADRGVDDRSPRSSSRTGSTRCAATRSPRSPTSPTGTSSSATSPTSNSSSGRRCSPTSGRSRSRSSSTSSGRWSSPPG